VALRDALRFDPCVGKILWWRAWQPTPVFLPGESHGQRSHCRRRDVIYLRSWVSVKETTNFIL